MTQVQMSGVSNLTYIFCLSALLLFLNCIGVAAEPRTLYKPHDIENALYNIERYRWAQEIVRGWELDVEFALRQDREFFERIIPELTPGTHYGQNCPVCALKTGKKQGGNLVWSVTSPDKIRCSDCGTVYPNDAYPETGVVNCPRMGQTFTYYQTPAELALGDDATTEERARHALIGLGGHPRATSFTDVIRYRRVQWAWGKAITLAKLYALTGKTEYAERTAWILDRFAAVFPNYLYHSYYGDIADLPPPDVAAEMGSRGRAQCRYGGRFSPDAIRNAYDFSKRSDEQGEYSTIQAGFWGAGRMACHGHGSDAGPLLSMIVAYDLTREALYRDGTPVYDQQMHRRVVEDLILAGTADVEHWNSKTNKGVATYTVSAAVGLLFEQPERMRRALNGFNLILDDAYHFDGFYSQSPGYAVHNFSNMAELPDLLYAYSDPEGYQPQEGARLENLNPFSDGRFGLVLEAMVKMLAPGNRLPTIGSTSADRDISPLYAEVMAARLGGPYPALLETIQGVPLAEQGTAYALWYRDPDLKPNGPAPLPLRSEWFPGWQVGVLRGETKPAGDTALYLVGNEHNWTIETTHRHRDILSLIYYAFGEQMLHDRHQGHPSFRGPLPSDWPSQWSPHLLTHTHNAVVVDEQNQWPYGSGWQARTCGSHLELFGVGPGVELVQASAFNIYRQCEEYRRTATMVQVPGDHTYVVDFFRVRGGQTHQYILHHNGTPVALKPADPEPQAVELSQVWRGLLTDPRQVTPQLPHTVTSQYRGVSLDTTVLNTTDTVDRIILAAAEGDEESPPIHQVLVENRAAEGVEALISGFATLMVPYTTEASPMLSARLLECDTDSGAMAVEVRLRERTDYIISTLDQHPRQYGPVTASGQFAFVSLDDEGQVLNAYLLAGTSLQCGQVHLTLPQPNYTLRVASVSDRTFHLVEPLPPGLAAGTYLLAEGPHPLQQGLPRPRTGFEIETTTADSITVRDYPPLECDEVTILNSMCMHRDN